MSLKSGSFILIAQRLHHLEQKKITIPLLKRWIQVDISDPLHYYFIITAFVSCDLYQVLIITMHFIII